MRQEPVFVRQEASGALMVNIAPDWMVQAVEIVGSQASLDAPEQVTLKVVIRPSASARGEKK